MVSRNKITPFIIATVLAACATTSSTHVLLGEQHFSRGEFHDAHVNFELAKKNKESLPSFMSAELLDERITQSKQYASAHQADLGKNAIKTHNWEDYNAALEILTKFYPSDESAQGFLQAANDLHEKAVTILADAETGEKKADAVAKLLQFNWYKSAKDKFETRYIAVMMPFYKDVLGQAETMFRKDGRNAEALKTLAKAFEYFPEDKKALALKEEIELQQKAEESRKKIAQLLKKNDYKEAIANLEIISKADPKNEDAKKQLEDARAKYSYYLVDKGQKECTNQSWWSCRQYISQFEKLGVKAETQDTLLNFKKQADWEIGKELYERSQKSWEEEDPAMAMIWFQVARTLGEPTSPINEAKLQEELNETVKYKIGIYPPELSKRPPIENANDTILTKLHEKLVADPDFSKAISIIPMDKKNTALKKPDATLRGKFGDFSIVRSVHKEKRSGKYVHHVEEHPNPEYVNSQKRVVAAEGERDSYFEKLQKAQETHDKTQEDLKAIKKQLDLDRAAYEAERIECSNIPTDKEMAQRKKDLDAKISELVKSGQDDQVGATIAKWREENKVNHRECEIKKFEAQVAKSKVEFDKISAEYDHAKKVYEEAKEYYLSITNQAFDAEIDHKAIPKNIAVNVMQVHHYEVELHEAKGNIQIDYQLKDALTGENLVSVTAASDLKEQDFATQEVGITPPEYEYQVIEEAHEPNVRDDVEISEILVDKAVSKLYDQIRYGLAFHGKRFVKAGDKAKTDFDKMRYALLTIYAEKYLIDPKGDLKRAKQVIKDLLGFDWDKRSIDFETLQKHQNGKSHKLSWLFRALLSQSDGNDFDAISNE